MKKICFIIICISTIWSLYALDEILTFGNIRYRVDDDTVAIVCAVTKNVTTIDIPDYIEQMPVLSIDDGAFAGCTSLTAAHLPDTLIHIGSRTFYNCRLLGSITIPKNVIYIGEAAFQNCFSLTNIDMPDFIVGIEAETFRGCRSLHNVSIPNGAVFIADNAFSGCKAMQSIIMPDSINRIGRDVFSGCPAAPRFTITFSLGDTDVTSDAVLSERIIRIDNPTAADKIFVGWFTDETRTQLYDFDTIVTGNITLYAKFVSRRTPIKAPAMRTLIRKNASVTIPIGSYTAKETTDDTVSEAADDISADTADKNVTLTAYQLSSAEVTYMLYESVMGYAPPKPVETEADISVTNINIYQAITFCNKLSLRAGRTPCYTADEISDWVDLSVCDIPAKDGIWHITINLDANGYRLPTNYELRYACSENVITDEQCHSAMTNDDISETAALTKTNMPNETALTDKIIRLARTIK